MNHKSRRIPRNALFKTWSQYRLYHEIVCFCWPTMQYMYVFSVASAEWIQSQFSVLLIMVFPNNNNIENCINIISLYDYKTNINIKYDKHVTICNAFSITNVYTIRELSHYQHHHCQRCRCRRRRCRLVPFVSIQYTNSTRRHTRCVIVADMFIQTFKNYPDFLLHFD